MKILLKVAVIAVLSQIVLAGAVYAEAARPVAVSVNVEEFSEVSGAISDAVAAGDNYKADQLLSDLYSGGLKPEAPAPVRADKCCCQCAVNTSTAAPAGPATPVVAANDYPPLPQLTPEEAAAKKAKEAEEKAKKDAADKKEEATKLKRSGWGLAIMVVSLLLFIVLL